MSARRVRHTFPLLVCSLFLVLLPALLSSQTLPEGALEAEHDGRWVDAARLYRDALSAEPERADLWKRLADVLAADGRTEEAAVAFERAAGLASDAELFAQASAARAMLDQPWESLRLIEEALRLEPARTDYLRRRADLMTWVGDYQGAEESVVRLLEQAPEDPALLAEMSRLLAWQERLGEAADYAKRSLEADPANVEIWLQLARIESWCGDYSEALSLLDEYLARGGEPLVHDGERALVLAWADRPEAALAVVEPALARDPNHPQLLFARAVAFERLHRYDAMLRDIETLEGQESGNVHDVAELRRFLTTGLRPHLDLDTVGSRDRDGIERLGSTVRFDIGVGEGDVLKVGVSSLHSSAPQGSPLAPLGDETDGRVSSAWGGFDLTLSPRWSLAGRMGGARTSFGDSIVEYDASVRARFGDAMRLWLGQERRYLDVSPRALSLGVIDTRTHGSLSVVPSLSWRFDLTGEIGRLSDDNNRWSLLLGARRIVFRKTKWNLDLGWSGLWMGYAHDLDNGYYDPKSYQRHLFPASFYFKLSNDDGVGLVVAPGLQKDAKMTGIEPAGELALDATFGIYRGWMFQARFAAGLGASDYSQDYWLTSGGFFLVKRF